MTLVVAVAELFAVLGSGVVELVVALSLIVLPEAAVTFTTSVSVMLLPDARLGAVQDTAPLPPG